MHHKSYGLVLRTVNEVQRSLVYTLVNIIIFFFQRFCNILGVLLSFQILEDFHTKTAVIIHNNV